MYFSEDTSAAPLRSSNISPDEMVDDDDDEDGEFLGDGDGNGNFTGLEELDVARKISVLSTNSSNSHDTPEKNLQANLKQSNQKKIPTTGMLTLSFRSRVERELFSNAIHLCNSQIVFASDCQMLEGKDTVRFKCGTLNAIGMQSEIVILVNCKKSKIWFGEDSDSPSAQCEDIVCTPSLTNQKRVDVQYPQNEATVGSRILQSHDDSSERKMVVISLSFASAFLRERFLGRIRALKINFKGVDPQETLPLPSGESLLVCTASWNLGDKGPPEDLDKLETWIPAGAHDIYAIGLQECAFKKKWFKALQDYLCGESARVKLKNRLQADSKMEAMTGNKQSSNIPKSSYVLLSIQSLWSIHLVIICRSDLKARIRQLTSSTEATGIAHVLGNKGGVATGFVIDNTTSLAFVTSHLAARVTRLHTRQENYEEIVNGLHLGGMAHGAQPVKAMDFLHSYDHVFWFGDMNYRIDLGTHGTPKEYKKVVKLATDPDERYQLQDFDQLRKQMNTNSVLCDFEEGAIDFPPTYRMLKNGDGYSNKKYQNPSYCDRVLWKSLPGSAPQLYQTLYASAPNLNSSDHRPVCANFHVNVREPFIARGPIVSDGGLNGPDLVIISINDLKFTVVPETAHEKAKRAYKFDGYSGPAVCSFGSLVFTETYCSAPAKIKARQAAKNFKKLNSSLSRSSSIENNDSADSTNLPKEGLPEWEWDNRDILDMFPSVSDCEWLSTQNIACVLRKGNSDGQIMGQCEIPLSSAFADLIEETRRDDEEDEGGLGIGEVDDIGEGDEFFGSSMGSPSIDRTNLTKNESTRQSHQDAENNKLYVGAPFKSHVLIHGKYIGNLSGRVLMKSIAGIRPDEDDAEIADKLITLKQTLLGLRKKRVERIAVAEAPTQENVVVTRKADADKKSNKHDENKIDAIEFATKPVVVAATPTVRRDDGAVGVAKKTVAVEGGGDRSDDEGGNNVVNTMLENNQDNDDEGDHNDNDNNNNNDNVDDDDDDDTYIEEPVLLRIGGKAKRLDGNESDNEDDEDEVDDEEEQLGPAVWLEGDEVVWRGGKRWHVDDFICQITGQNLVEEDFILKNGEKFSRAGYLEMFGKDDLCAHCLKRAKKSENVLYALNFKWHANHLKCSHSGNELPIHEKILIKDKMPYNEQAYEELFHTCPRCLDVVPLNSELEKGVQALNQVWHKDCFNCDACGKDFEDGHFFKHENKNDGRGMMPYCQECFKVNFMPQCQSCKEFIITPVEESVEACGGFFHPDCFKCAATGAKIEGGFITREELPYTPEAYYANFGDRCAKCAEVMKEKIVSVLGQKWHPDCFTCTSSGKPIPVNEQGEYVYYEHDLMPYGAEEYSRLFGETCCKCHSSIEMSENVEVWLGENWHRGCLTCESCKKLLVDIEDGKICQGPEDGMPYCAKCYGTRFGEVCAACRFPINPGETPIDALGKIWHKKHFCCVKCHTNLFREDESGGEINEFFPHEDLPFCEDCYIEYLCERCGSCCESIKPGEEKLTLQDGKGGRSIYHKNCHKCFIYGTIFTRDEAIFMHEGNPFCEKAYIEAFADHVCVGCGEGIAGARQIALDKSWHPGHITCTSCKAEMANDEIFIRQETDSEGGKWPVCQKHMVCKFDELSDIAKKKLNGENWCEFDRRKAVALETLEKKLERKFSKQVEGNASGGLGAVLSAPFQGFEEEMRQELGIRGKKRGGS